MTELARLTHRHARLVRDLLITTGQLYLDAYAIGIRGTFAMVPTAKHAFWIAIPTISDPCEAWNDGWVSESDRPDFFQSIADHSKAQTRVIEALLPLVETLERPGSPDREAWSGIVKRLHNCHQLWGEMGLGSSHLAAAHCELRLSKSNSTPT